MNTAPLTKFPDVVSAFESTWARNFTAPLTSAKYHQSITLAEAIFSHLELPRRRFVAITVGAATDPPQMAQGLDFPRRVLGTSASELNPRHRDLLLRQNQLALDLGLLVHLVGQTFPSRHEYQRTNAGALFDEWRLNAMVADVKLREYDKASGRLPSRFFATWFEGSVATSLKHELRLGYWKRVKAES